MQAASATPVTLTAGQDMDRDATSSSAPAASVQVFVTGNNGKTQAVQVDANQDVAEAVAHQTGVNCVDNFLTFGGRPVKDATYQDLGLQQGSTLRAQPVGVMCGGVGFYVPLHDVHANALESCQDCCKTNCCCCCT